MPIYVEVATSSSNGASYAYQFREQLRASQTYRIVLQKAESAFVVGLVAVDPDQNTVAVGVTLAIDNDNGYDHLVDNWVVSVGRLNIANSASTIIALIDKDVQDVLKAITAKK